MMRRRMVGRGAGVALVVAVTISVVGPGVAHAQPSAPTVLVSGLNNPRQLSILSGGDLLIAEAGNGGATKIGSGKNASFVGTSGSISVVVDPVTGTNETPHRILTGFLSSAGRGGIGAVGSDGVSALTRKHIYVQETFFPGVPPFFPDQSGQLFVSRTHGVPTSVADISAFNQANDPDGQPFDSDPYAVLVTGPQTELVADAASNDILSITNGTPSVFHVFPNITGGACAKVHDPTKAFPGCNFVPTAMARDQAGNVYVTGLGSLVPTAGEVVELDPTGANVLKTWTGFTAPDGIVVRKTGDIFVSQLFAPEANPVNPMIEGVVTEIPASGGAWVNTDVPFPSGLALRAGNLYISAFSIAPADGLGFPGTSGQVWRMTLDGTSD